MQKNLRSGQDYDLLDMLPMCNNNERKFVKAIRYVVLSDYGMWRCPSSESERTTFWFETQEECESYIRSNFGKENQEFLLSQMREEIERRKRINHNTKAIVQEI